MARSCGRLSWVALTGVVALLLLLTYRSPVLWLVPLTVVGIAEAHGVPVARLGTTDADRLKVKDVLDLGLEEMGAAHTGTMARYFG